MDIFWTELHKRDHFRWNNQSITWCFIFQETNTIFIISHSVGAMSPCNRIECVTIHKTPSFTRYLGGLFGGFRIYVLIIVLFFISIIFFCSFQSVVFDRVMFKYLDFKTQTHTNQWLATIKLYSIPISIPIEPSNLPSILSSVKKGRKKWKWKMEN